MTPDEEHDYCVQPGNQAPQVPPQRRPSRLTRDSPGPLEADHISLSLVPEDPTPLTETQRRAVGELLRVSQVADDLGRLFADRGHALALVGGSVRDALLGRLGNDLDLTTDARPGRVLHLVRGWADAVWETGIAYGTVGVRKGGFRLEITTYRSESYARASRKPDVRYGESLDDDLSRRDFTVNAMALTLPGHRFADPFGGRGDLVRRLLRTPRRPETAFGDDPLRMLRAARFSAQLGFGVAPEAIAAMRQMAGRIDIVSAERVRDELVKLILAPFPRRGITLLADTGLADRVLPEVPRLRMEIDEHRRHKDVYEHTLTVLEQAMELEEPGSAAPPGSPGSPGSPDLVLRLAALLHDIGKPKTRSFEPGGGVSFHHHEVVGAHMARHRLSALKFPKDIVADVARLVELHLRFHGYGDGEWTDSAVRRYVRDAGHLLERLHKLTRSDCTTRNRKKATALARACDDLEARIERLRRQEELDAIRPDLDGNEIMAILGIRPGPLVGRAYQHLLELRMDRGPMARDEVVAELQRWWADLGEA